MKLCRGMCKFMIHRWIKEFDKRSNGFLGMHAPTGCGTAAGSKDSEHKNDYNSFLLDSIAMEFYGDMCRYMKDILATGFIKLINGRMRNAKII